MCAFHRTEVRFQILLVDSVIPAGLGRGLSPFQYPTVAALTGDRRQLGRRLTHSFDALPGQVASLNTDESSAPGTRGCWGVPAAGRGGSVGTGSLRHAAPLAPLPTGSGPSRLRGLCTNL